MKNHLPSSEIVALSVSVYTLRLCLIASKYSADLETIVFATGLILFDVQDKLRMNEVSIRSQDKGRKQNMYAWKKRKKNKSPSSDFRCV